MSTDVIDRLRQVEQFLSDLTLDDEQGVQARDACAVALQDARVEFVETRRRLRHYIDVQRESFTDELPLDMPRPMSRGHLRLRFRMRVRG